ncbi:MAG: hypothetical protein K0S37_4563 [Microbacterium sp.]|jgi:hypothetical protein|nr:hypothetical protein [Microbacterium sp.]
MDRTTTPRISYVPLEQMDERMKVEMERCAKHGTPLAASKARPSYWAAQSHV